MSERNNDTALSEITGVAPWGLAAFGFAKLLEAGRRMGTFVPKAKLMRALIEGITKHELEPTLDDPATT